MYENHEPTFRLHEKSQGRNDTIHEENNGVIAPIKKYAIPNNRIPINPEYIKYFPYPFLDIKDNALMYATILDKKLPIIGLIYIGL